MSPGKQLNGRGSRVERGPRQPWLILVGCRPLSASVPSSLCVLDMSLNPASSAVRTGASISPPFCRGGNRGSVRLSHLPKVTQQLKKKSWGSNPHPLLQKQNSLCSYYDITYIIKYIVINIIHNGLVVSLPLEESVFFPLFKHDISQLSTHFLCMMLFCGL